MPPGKNLFVVVYLRLRFYHIHGMDILSYPWNGYDKNGDVNARRVITVNRGRRKLWTNTSSSRLNLRRRVPVLYAVR